MPWFKITRGRFGFGRNPGPPPSYRLTWVHLVFKDWDAYEVYVAAKFEKYERALKAAHTALCEELRK